MPKKSGVLPSVRVRVTVPEPSQFTLIDPIWLPVVMVPSPVVEPAIGPSNHEDCRKVGQRASGRTTSQALPRADSASLTICFAFDRLLAISEPRNAPANPATCEAMGFKEILSAANDTAQKPIRPAPAIFVIFESLIT
jgi:hypothetical protein